MQPAHQRITQAQQTSRPVSPLERVQQPIHDMLTRFLRSAETPAQAKARHNAEQATEMALALNRTGKHVYAGTVRPNVIAKRRAHNKAARHTRQAQRRG